MVWESFRWEGSVRLPSWAGFQQRQGPYASVSSRKPSKGEAQLYIEAEAAEDGTPALPSAAQRRAFAFLLAKEKALGEALQKRFLRAYPRLRAQALADDEELAEVLPAAARVSGLRKVLGLGNVHLSSVALKGQAYVGFEFGCAWDEEHGLGVLTHGARIVAVGAADVSYRLYVAEEDRRAREAPEPKPKRKPKR